MLKNCFIFNTIAQCVKAWPRHSATPPPGEPFMNAFRLFALFCEGGAWANNGGLVGSVVRNPQACADPRPKCLGAGAVDAFAAGMRKLEGDCARRALRASRKLPSNQARDAPSRALGRRPIRPPLDRPPLASLLSPSAAGWDNYARIFHRKLHTPDRRLPNFVK